MSKVRINGFSISADGYGAGPDQSVDNPLGIGKDIRIGGGVSVVRQYLQAGLIDDAHFAIAPALLGAGEQVFGGMNLPALGYDLVEHAASESALHLVFAKGRL